MQNPVFYVVNIAEGYLDSYSAKEFIEFLNEGDISPMACRNFYNSSDYKIFTDYKSAKEKLIAVEKQLEDGVYSL